MAAQRGRAPLARWGSPMSRQRLLAIMPDPSAAFSQAGGALSAARVVASSRLSELFEVRFVDTTMRAHPPPGVRERLQSGAARMARALRVMDGWTPDVALAFCIHGVSFYEKTALLLLAKRRGARVYLSPRSGFGERWLEGSAAARLAVRAAGRALDGFLVQSERWRDVYARFGVPEGKLHVWPNPVDTDVWAPIAEARTPASSARPFRFLFLGWANADKGLPELVEATRQLEARGGPPFEVTIVGDGEYGERLRELTAQGALPAPIRWLGWVIGSDRSTELLRADALVLPTHAEGFPNVVVEAMACGLPVISTPVGAIPEIVLDGETGILVPPRSVGRLVEAMDRLRANPTIASEMGRRGVERVRSRFALEQSVTRLITVLSSDSGGTRAGA